MTDSPDGSTSGASGGDDSSAPDATTSAQGQAVDGSAGASRRIALRADEPPAASGSDGRTATTTTPTTTTPTTTTPATTTSTSDKASSAATQEQEPASPTVITGQASAVTTTGATLAGTVSPAGSDTRYHFEYWIGSTAHKKTASRGAGSGDPSVSVTADLSSLKPNTKYSFRLVATNDGGTTNGAEQKLTTAASEKPTATTGSATGTGTTTLTFTGTVDPHSNATAYVFEYGTTSALGSTTPRAAAGSAAGSSTVSKTVNGLKPDTTYAFRIVATNAAGTTRGTTQYATTAASSCAADTVAVAEARESVEAQQQALADANEALAETYASVADSSAPSTTEIAQAEAQLAQAQATLASAQTELAATVLRAPITGTVTDVNAVVGDTSGSSGARTGSTGGSLGGTDDTSSTDSFATIATVKRLQIVAGFAESDATRLAVGQSAVVTFPSLPSTQVEGEVTAVSSTSTVVSNVVTYDVTIALLDPPSSVKQGMTASVNVIVEKRENVLQLPSAAITSVGPASTVEVLVGGETTVLRVTTGLVGSSSTEIVSGLEEGAVVVIPTVTIDSSSTGNAQTGLGGGLGGAFPGGGFTGGGRGGGFVPGGPGG